MKSEFEKFIEKAHEQRRPFLVKAKEEETTCFRLFSGAREGIPGLIADQYGEMIILQVHEGACQLSSDEIQKAAQWWLSSQKVKSVYAKTFVADRSKKIAGTEYYASEPLVGEPASELIEAKEKGISYWIKPYEGYSTGIFLDQRENRAFLAERAKKKSVLNLFSYTCAFSVACAKAGAITTSVDLSAKFLDWGKRNFLLNNLKLEEHEFLVVDTFDFLKRNTKLGKTYDLLIIDPPSFSRTKKGGVFSLKKDFLKLLEASLPLVSKGGELFFSCNFSEWDSESLAFKSKKAFQGRQPKKWIKLPAAPADFRLAEFALSQLMVCL